MYFEHKNMIMRRMSNFLKNNSNVKAENIDGKLILYNCWNDNSFRFEFSDDEKLTFLKNVVLYKELFAIYHMKENMYEFIFLPLQEKYEREFNIYIVVKLTVYITLNLQWFLKEWHFILC